MPQPPTATPTQPGPAPWWRDTVFYEVVVANFADGNADGIGDFAGLTQRLDYLQALGINGLWLTPFYPSPGVDNGYDVADYCAVDAKHGSLGDFDAFITAAHARGIQVIVDMVFNHVSTKHPWFQQAAADPASPYRDYFFFRDQPNNWHSFFGGSAWQKEPQGEQFYFHKFAPEQADLNWANPAVRAEIRSVIRFWLDRGVDGFRLDVINFLSCDGLGPENPTGPDGKQIHRHDIDQPGILTCLRQLCADIRADAQARGVACFLVGEVGHDQLHKLAPYQGHGLLDVVFNFNLGSIKGFDAARITQELTHMEALHIAAPTLFFNSHDMPRSMSRLCNGDPRLAAALAALVLLARGVPFLYYGEEIGMTDFVPATPADLRDAQALTHYRLALQSGQSEAQAFSAALAECRDKSRAPMPWGDTDSASDAQANRPEPNPNPKVTTARQQPDSLWHWYRQLITLRHAHPGLCEGAYQRWQAIDGHLRFTRRAPGALVHVAINLSNQEWRPDVPAGAAALLHRGWSPAGALAGFGVLVTREALE